MARWDGYLVLTAKSLWGFSPLPPGFPLTCFLPVAGGEAGTAEAAGEGAHSRKGEH